MRSREKERERERERERVKLLLYPNQLPHVCISIEYSDDSSVS